MRRRSLSLIAVIAIAASFGAGADTATSKPVDLKLGVTGSPGRAVVAGDIVTVRASIQKLTRTGGTATSFRFLFTLSRGLKLVAVTPSSGRFNRGSGRLTLMQLRPGKPIGFTIRARVLASASGAVAFSATVYPGAGWRETRSANNKGSRRWTVAPPPAKLADLGVAITDGRETLRGGSPNAYTVTVGNGGPTTVSTLGLEVFTGLVAATYTASTGSYNAASGTWSGLSLAKGGSVTLTVSGDTPPSTGRLTATANVSPSAGTTDPARGNNTATDSTTLTTR